MLEIDVTVERYLILTRFCVGSGTYLGVRFFKKGPTLRYRYVGSIVLITILYKFY